MNSGPLRQFVVRFGGSLNPPDGEQDVQMTLTGMLTFCAVYALAVATR